MRASTLLMAFAPLMLGAAAAPHAQPAPAPAVALTKRGALQDALNTIHRALSGAVADISTAVNSLISLPATTPTSIAQVVALVQAIWASNPTLVDATAQLFANGLGPSDVMTLLMTFSLGCNSEYNINLLPPSVSVYPKKASGDAPYSTPEGTLRRAIQIPAGFTYGRKQPVILVPGTGTKGCLTFTGNFIKLLSGTSYADPVWLNIPHFLLDDVQTNAEYVAYAINYISAISGKKNVAVIGWSQGNILSQWALKYWPSTRSVVSDLISMSPDFHGSAGSTLLCVDGCAPAIIQQDYNSQLIAALRSNGGDSGYVPTTSIYSAADQVVQPQSGTGASAYLKDARNVGVTNNELQVICPNVGNVTHEGVLYNGLAVALALDALQNAGPGQTSRLNLNTVCNQTAAPGLTLADIVSTENTIPIATIAIMLYPNKVIAEPALMAYAST